MELAERGSRQRGLDGVRTELTPQPSKICKRIEASDGTGPESETCSRLTRAGVNLQRGPDCKQAAGRKLKGLNQEDFHGNSPLIAMLNWPQIFESCLKGKNSCKSVQLQCSLRQQQSRKLYNVAHLKLFPFTYRLLEVWITKVRNKKLYFLIYLEWYSLPKYIQMKI